MPRSLIDKDETIKIIRQLQADFRDYKTVEDCETVSEKCYLVGMQQGLSLSVMLIKGIQTFHELEE